jgi:hypothetical protein
MLRSLRHIFTVDFWDKRNLPKNTVGNKYKGLLNMKVLNFYHRLFILQDIKITGACVFHRIHESKIVENKSAMNVYLCKFLKFGVK